MFDPQIRRRSPIAALLIAALSACSGGGGSQQPASAAQTQSVPRAVEQTDLQIASLLYGGSRTPDGFSVEPNSTGYELLAKTHIKNTDLGAGTPSDPQFELCTNDWNEALGWSEAIAQQASSYSPLVATNDEARYFEFGRVRAGTPDVYTQSRVYKCDYLDRSSTNLRAKSGAAGHLNARPLDAGEMQRLSEYLWQFTSFNNFGHVVLKSDDTGPYEHTLFIASLVRHGVSSNCDRIDVIAWRHRAEATNGSTTLTVQDLWSFGAREAGGVAQLCTN